MEQKREMANQVAELKKLGLSPQEVIDVGLRIGVNYHFLGCIFY